MASPRQKPSDSFPAEGDKVDRDWQLMEYAVQNTANKAHIVQNVSPEMNKAVLCTCILWTKVRVSHCV